MLGKIAVAAVATTLVAALGAPASAGGAKQSVSGSFVTPGKYTDNSCYAGLTRRSAVITNGAANGVTGFHFDIDKGTWNKPFVLTPTGGQGRIDLDIVFYTEFGTVEQATDTGFAPPNVGFENRTTEGESGKVPPDMNKAIVCMYIDEAQTPPGGIAAEFTYEAGKGVKLPK
jgi:hypothetical protein